MKRLAGYLFQGFLYATPLGVTAYVLWQIFVFVDAPVRRLGELLLGVELPGLGLVTVAAILTLLGWLGQTIIARPVKRLLRSAIDRAPLVRTIEGSVRELLASLFSRERRFSRPVLVRMSGDTDLEKLGFITQDDLSDLGVSGKVAVYFPHSYNFSGELFIVPRERVRPVSVPTPAAMKFIVSGGMIHLHEPPRPPGGGDAAP